MQQSFKIKKTLCFIGQTFGQTVVGTRSPPIRKKLINDAMIFEGSVLRHMLKWNVNKPAW